jgi:hypothetical protein
LNNLEYSFSIFQHFADRQELENEPTFNEMLATAVNLHEPECCSDLRKMADAIEECRGNWYDWAGDWFYEQMEQRSKERDERYLRNA